MIATIQLNWFPMRWCICLIDTDFIACVSRETDRRNAILRYQKINEAEHFVKYFNTVFLLMNQQKPERVLGEKNLFQMGSSQQTLNYKQR